LTPTDKIGCLQCADFVETRPFTANKGRRLVKSAPVCKLSVGTGHHIALTVVIIKFMFSAYMWVTNFNRIFTAGTGDRLYIRISLYASVYGYFSRKIRETMQLWPACTCSKSVII